jgi:SAM-dependent methyltransferase
VWALTAYDMRSAYSLAVGAALVALLAGMFYYLPLYLGLTTERRKRFVWSVRVRWIAIPVLTVLALVVSRSLDEFVTVGDAAAALLGANVVARLVLKYGSDDAFEFVPVIHLVAEMAVLALLTPLSVEVPIVSIGFALSGVLFALSTDGLKQFAGALFAGAMCFVRLGSFQLAGESIQGEDPRFILAPLAAIAGAVLLARVASRHHAANVSRTVSDLAEYSEVSPDSARELLATSTAALATSWNAAPPTDPEAVSRWYSDNSRHYLFDLAQFHLAYKHVAFSLDVINLAKGRVLDHGAGIGDVALALARRGRSVTYVDVPGETQGFARWRAEREGLDVAFANDLEQAPGPFDTIISLDVLEHVAEPEPVVDALVDRLAPNGVFVVTAYFGPTKAHPMHMNHDLDLKRYLAAKGLRDSKGFALRYLRSEIMRKPGVLVFTK